jgi:pimeloyl-ACP methyl ester carboxylesterase
MKLVLIPGAYSSPIMWMYFKAEMPKDIESIYLDYNPELSLEDILHSFEKKLNGITDDITVVGHSLGGILAVLLAGRCKQIKKVITIAAPFGGILISRWMAYVSLMITPFNKLWNNTHPDNKLLRQLRDNELPAPVLVYLVETQNSTMWFEPSDGVVTLYSQKALGDKKDITYKKVYCTHADGMMHPDIISDINAMLTTP